MSWWQRPVQWFGKEKISFGTVKDGRAIRVFSRSIGKYTVITHADVQCSKCGDWITEAEDVVVTKDGMGSSRNEHKQCPTPRCGQRG
jgi:hypothetical protein